MVNAARREMQPIEIVCGVGDEVVVCVLDKTCLHRALWRTNKVEGEVFRVIEIDHPRMGKLNFDIDEASLLKTYGLSTLAPTYAIFGRLRTCSD